MASTINASSTCIRYDMLLVGQLGKCRLNLSWKLTLECKIDNNFFQTQFLQTLKDAANLFWGIHSNGPYT